MARHRKEEPLVRLHVNMNGQTRRELDHLQERTGYSYTEVVRRALALYRFLWKAQRDGKVITSENRRGTDVKEIHLL